ncbi:hypothetical protein ATOP_19330 [Granulimonas faecalis]|uniref:Single-stranded DNA-binding protein n=1 Tax=Granulimonas faecalis TaxID=2894155 RepID=A0AAV5B7C8_9ACTN|nr:hypothetical protein [Granulimonas faecalis]GJM56278.1 hypothetical protein ATOP_19330 [Granulimonas faecalis]
MNKVMLSGKIASKKGGRPNVVCFDNGRCHNWRLTLMVKDDFASQQPVYKNGAQVFNTDGTPATEQRHGYSFIDIEVPVFADRNTGQFHEDILMRMFKGEVDVVSIVAQMSSSTFTDKQTGETRFKQTVRVASVRDIMVESWAPRTGQPAPVPAPAPGAYDQVA